MKKRGPATAEEVEGLLEEISIRNSEYADLKHENDVLRRELDSWQRRAERAERSEIKWKAAADEWRTEWMKRSGSERGRLQRER